MARPAGKGLAFLSRGRRKRTANPKSVDKRDAIKPSTKGEAIRPGLPSERERQ